MTDVRKIAHNTLIQVIGKALSIAIGLIGFGLMARYLGQEGFGYYSTIYAFLAIFGILIDLGLQMTTTQLISDPAEDESRILSNSLTIRLTASIIFLGVAPLIALFFPYPKIIKIGIAVAAVGFIFTSLVSTLTSLFQKHLVMYKVATADVVAKILFIVVLISAVSLDLGLMGIISAVVIDSFFTFAILFYFASQKVLIRPAFDLLVWRKIISRTWPIALTIGLNLIYFKGDIFIMSLIKSQTEVGLYGAPYKVLEVLININYLFLGLILPILTMVIAVKNLERLKIVIQSTFNFLIILTTPLIVGGYFLGRPLMVLMAGPDFVISGDIIKILLIATGAILTAGLFGYVIVALNKQKQMIKFYAANAIISIIGYLIFIPLYSYWGAAWMTVFTEVFILFTAAYVMKKNINFLPGLKIFWKSIAAALVMAIPLYLFPNLSFIISLTIGVVVYFIALYLLKGFDKETVLDIIKIKNHETPDNQL